MTGRFSIDLTRTAYRHLEEFNKLLIGGEEVEL